MAVISAGCGTKSDASSNATSKTASTASTATTTGNSGKVKITYATWQTQELAGMKAIAAKFTEENPNIEVDVQLTPWDQYWTKLQAAANGGTLPDVFWQHANNFYQYASNGKLMDITDKFKNSDKGLSWDNYPKDLVDFYTVDGKHYGIPKDYDTIGLWYNKKLFDAKGIKYPDETWNWDKLRDAAKKLTDSSKSVYGFCVPVSLQECEYNFIYQNNGNVISKDKKKSGYDLPATEEALQYLLDIANNDKSSPTISQLANTTYEQYFLSGKVAMCLFGSWNVADFLASDYVKKNCDVAIIPQGKTKATIYNGLANCIAANTKHPDEAWKFLEYLGGKEANTIQSQCGSAIPAYKGCEAGWIDHFKNFNCKIYPQELSYGIMYPNSPSQPTWSQYENDILPKIFKGTLTLKDGCSQLAQKMNAAIGNE